MEPLFLFDCDVRLTEHMAKQFCLLVREPAEEEMLFLRDCVGASLETLALPCALLPRDSANSSGVQLSC